MAGYRGLLIQFGAIGFHRWLQILAAACGHDAAAFSFYWVEAKFRRDPGAWRRYVQ
jgi:hypothetical protein